VVDRAEVRREWTHRLATRGREQELEPLVAADVRDDEHLVLGRREGDHPDPFLRERQLLWPAARRRNGEYLRHADDVGDERDAAPVGRVARPIGPAHVDEAGVVEGEPRSRADAHPACNFVAVTEGGRPDSRSVTTTF
jgi:hypothetical protein